MTANRRKWILRPLAFICVAAERFFQDHPEPARELITMDDLDNDNDNDNDNDDDDDNDDDNECVLFSPSPFAFICGQ
jgi:hypothetical protein